MEIFATLKGSKYGTTHFLDQNITSVIRKLHSEVASPFKGTICKDTGPEKGKRLLQLRLAPETPMG